MALLTLLRRGGPYPSTMAGLGGAPNKSVDVPISSVFLVLFIIGAVAHMTILQVNRRRGRKFLMSGMLFGFCMARIMAMTMRLVWSTHLSNVSVAIAANIFVSAGVILLLIVNLIFVQRILRAVHSDWAWAKWASSAFKIYYASIIVILIALIIGTVQSFYTLSINTKRIDRDIQLVGATYFTVAAFLPLPLLALRLLIRPKQHVEKFGEGHHRTKIAILVFSSAILTMGAAFRAGIAYKPRPVSHPAWYHSKACFYLFNFTIEIIVVYLYAVMRVDKRFWVPNGSHGPGDYSESNKREKQKQLGVSSMINDEEEVFDDQGEKEQHSVGQRKDLESGTNTYETGESH